MATAERGRGRGLARPPGVVRLLADGVQLLSESGGRLPHSSGLDLTNSKRVPRSGPRPGTTDARAIWAEVIGDSGLSSPWMCDRVNLSDAA